MPIDESAPFEPKTQTAESRRPQTAASGAEPRAASAELVAFTIDAASGRLVKIERVDEAGARRDLSDVDRNRLAQTEGATNLHDLVEQAFQAGIDCVFGASETEDETTETGEETQLRRLLLRSLIARSPARRLLQGEALQQVIVGTLIGFAANGGGGPPEGAVAH